MIALKLAWRNVFRNRRRSLLTVSIIAFGLAVLILYDAIMKGSEESLVKSAVSTLSGEAQIHKRGYVESSDVSDTIVGSAQIEQRLGQDHRVDSFSSRVRVVAMIASATNTSQVLVYGIDAEKEKAISKIDDALIEGEYVRPGKERDILIGKALADLLNVGLGDRLILTAAEAGTGSLAQELFRVIGIYSFHSRSLDGGLAFVNLRKIQSALRLDNRVHEIGVKFKDFHSKKNESFFSEYSDEDNETKSWKKLFPQLEAVFEMSKASFAFVLILLFGIVAVAVMNSLFMALYERLFEFGVQKAIGTKSVHLFLMIFFEAGVLCLFGIIPGLILGYVFSKYFEVFGIQYTDFDMAGVSLHEPIYASMSLAPYLVFPIILLGFGLLAALYPAWTAARITPAVAMRKSL